AFGRNTRDMGSFGEETDKTMDLHQHCSRISPQKLETASQITRDAVTNPTTTASQDIADEHEFHTAEEQHYLPHYSPVVTLLPEITRICYTESNPEEDPEEYEDDEKEDKSSRLSDGWGK
ncbi:hypothetical protein Tco_0710761, partial [Tanacetum coccineum]